MIKKLLALLLLLLLITSLLMACDNDEKVDDQPKATEATDNQPQSIGIMKGVNLAPKSWDDDDYLDFLEKTKQTGEIVTWAGDWDELGHEEGGAANFLMSMASQYDFTPVVLAQFFTQHTGQLVRPLNAENKQHYREIAASFAKKYKPEYLVFGIEINVLYEKSLQDFEEFVDLYAEVYDAVKAVSPNTKVFTNFQLEKMKGLHGGLFGGTNDPDKVQWFLLDRFKQDIVSFSTYPMLIYKSPSEIPSDYYDEKITAHTSKSIAFTEIGWHSDDDIPGWESSETEQAEFIETFFTLTRNLDMPIAIWSFMFDQDIPDPFKHTGLIHNDGTAKPAWDAWVKSGS